MFCASVLPFYRTSQSLFTVKGFLFVFEKVRKTRKSGINFFVVAFAITLIQVLSALGTKSLAILAAKQSQGKIEQNGFGGE